ncbi:unnamed protein product [Phytophthora fragariaefolia]|uniref:Unnamed protein product n=1 Tax=Phytophthora fragariaefolia TaxID=1490495 RepID=A0A9W7D308_9STRA|nr:unnamed protein product [Phytophthora fragariaefolia]
MPARRVTRREAEAFLRRLEGREGADRERVVREHREYIDGTRDDDADFGDEGQKKDATSAPHTPTRRPRMTVTTSNSSASRHQKKRALSTFYDMLAKTPALRGKMPVAALNAEELAEQAAIAESELDDNRDEDYDESAERSRMMMPNAEFGTGSALTSPVGNPLQSPLELFLFFLPRKFWLKVKRVQPVLQTEAAGSDGGKVSGADGR